MHFDLNDYTTIVPWTKNWKKNTKNALTFVIWCNQTFKLWYIIFFFHSASIFFCISANPMFYDWTSFYRSSIAGVLTFSLTHQLLSKLFVSKDERQHWKRTNIGTSFLHSVSSSIFCIYWWIALDFSIDLLKSISFSASLKIRKCAPTVLSIHSLKTLMLSSALKWVYKTPFVICMNYSADKTFMLFDVFRVLGYFFFDFIDMYRRSTSRQSVGILLHHIIVSKRK